MNEDASALIKKNYHRVVENISLTAQRVGQDPDEICLVTVTKGHPIHVARAVAEAGAKYLGENYVEDALVKINALHDASVEWHMIGHIQSRKARSVCRYFDYVHSIDRLKIAKRLNQFAFESGRVLPVLLECNVSGELSKYGWEVSDKNSWEDFIAQVEIIGGFTNLEVRGLMTMPPYHPDPEKSRPYFQRLKGLQIYLKNRFPEMRFSDLSMGMSADYKVAVEEGATILRIGTEIVGPRSR